MDLLIYVALAEQVDHDTCIYSVKTLVHIERALKFL